MNEEMKTEEPSWLQEYLFQEALFRVFPGAGIKDWEDYGKGNYVRRLIGVKLECYQDYVALLQAEGFGLHSDSDMEGCCLASNLVKNGLAVTVNFFPKKGLLYLSAAEGLAFSEHLIAPADSFPGMAEGAKTKVHMLEMNSNGSSFVIQLKNGHFIVEDGGLTIDAPYLLDYLESLVPEGEKPVVEGWFMSHPHGDHFGAMLEISEHEEYRNRLCVDGIYFTRPTRETINELQWNDWEGEVLNRHTEQLCQCHRLFQRENGACAGFYRTVAGQRYYFCDIMVDVPFCLEQIPPTEYKGHDLNNTSTWLMHHIEGQRVLIPGDAAETALEAAMNFYDTSYFQMDVYVASHHGINAYNWFTDYCSVDTLLYPNWRIGSLWFLESSMTEEDRIKVANYHKFRSVNAEHLAAEAGNAYLQSKVKECYSRGEGTLVLTFPYMVGTAETAAPLDWRYNEKGEPDRTLLTNLEKNG